MSTDFYTVEAPSLKIGKSTYQVKHEYHKDEFSDTGYTANTVLIGPRGAVYTLVTMYTRNADGDLMDSGNRKAQPMMSDGFMRRGGNVVKFFQVGDVVEHIGFYA